MKQYESTEAFTAYNTGFLSGLRTDDTKALATRFEGCSPEESAAWQDGITDGQALRASFRLGDMTAIEPQLPSVTA